MALKEIIDFKYDVYHVKLQKPPFIDMNIYINERGGRAHWREGARARI